MRGSLQRGFFTVTIAFAVTIALIGFMYYALLYSPSIKKQEELPKEDMDSVPTEKVYRGTFEAFFEGLSQSFFKISYKPEMFFIIGSATTTKNVVIIEEPDGLMHTLRGSYEGGRGYSLTDYGNDIIKKSCKDCVMSTSTISVRGADTPLEYKGKDSYWFIYKKLGSGEWIYAWQFATSSKHVLDLVRGFRFDD